MKKSCDCLYHRYHVVNICVKCNKVFPHSQSCWDEHKLHGDIIQVDSNLYEHGMSVTELLNAKEGLNRK